MKKLIIIGAGSVGGFLALNQNLFTQSYDIIGFLDDDLNKIGKTFWGVKVIGSVDDCIKFKDVDFAIGITYPYIKKKIIQKMGIGIEFPNFIALNSWLSKDVRLGKGVIVYPGVSINHETKIGDFSVINMNCAIGHNTTIGDFCSLSPGVNLGGHTYVNDMVEIGIGAATIQSIEIGEGSKIGGQSMIIKNVEPDSTYVGVPAKIIK